MRIYSASGEETLRARRLLADWTADGFLTKEEYRRLEPETVCALRTTNIYLRLVLFFFTLISVGAAAALFFTIFPSRPSEHMFGIFLLIFAAVTYGAAEIGVAQFRLYRYGIEEGLSVCSVIFFCIGIQVLIVDNIFYSRSPGAGQFLVPAAGAVFSLWLWHRFGRSYAFPAAMIFALFVPVYWTSSHAAQHVAVAVLYSLGLLMVVALRSDHRLDYLSDSYSLAEAWLWLGIYLAINLQLSSLNLLGQWWGVRPSLEFAKPFYWATWVLIWCLPPIVLARGIRTKDRYIIAVGAIVAAMTLISNKPYLGWRRNTWDPMLLGVLLTGIAVGIQRWLDRGPGGIRHGFTARRFSGKDKQWMNVGSIVFGVLSPQPVTPHPQPSSHEVRFGGGHSGGGGASGDF